LLLCSAALAERSAESADFFAALVDFLASLKIRIVAVR
jgi:hypothetical protein